MKNCSVVGDEVGSCVTVGSLVPGALVGAGVGVTTMDIRAQAGSRLVSIAVTSTMNPSPWYASPMFKQSNRFDEPSRPLGEVIGA